MSGTQGLPECTGQSESIDIRLLPPVFHDVPILVPRKYQAKVGDGCRHPVERENIVVFEMFHEYHSFTKPLRHDVSTMMRSPRRGTVRHPYTFGPLFMRMTSGHHENLERDHLAIVPPLPNFGRLRGMLGTIILFHDSL